MPTFTGTNRNNSLTGQGAADTFFGLAGSDLIRGNGGNDTISGGEGADRLLGGTGDDLIYGYGSADLTAGSGDIRLDRVATGLSAPVFATSAPGSPDRLFIVEKTGAIRILDTVTGTLQTQPFLTLDPDTFQDGGEQGLLGLAFHPDYATNGRFFVFVTNAAGDLEIRSYTRDTANRADPDSENVILTIPHPDRDNHNGGWIGFGPDGYLYISTGDGGGSGDPDNNAQDLGSLLGKMLRIDVDGDDFASDPGRDYAIPDDNPFADGAGADEIWAYGLRNPWRPSFDRETGDLYIADVGQGEREEINWQPGNSTGGENYGWVIREGDLVYDPDRPGNPGPDDPSLIDPVLDYPHTADGTGGFSVTGGYVYRGQGAGLQGSYLYADFVTDQIWSFRMVDGRLVDAANRTAQLTGQGADVGSIASFGEDGRGNLFVISLSGQVFRLTPGAAAGDMADRIEGGDGNDRIHGGAGNDRIYGETGNDRLFGGSQDDLLYGGAGVEQLTGGAGTDWFVFGGPADSGVGAGRRDVIMDFTDGDLIYLRGIDARAGTAGDQNFTFIGTAAFSAEGQVRAAQAGTDVILSLNMRGATGAEMEIRLEDVLVSSLTTADFRL
jgi:glucose/arabinose dehydrogenase